MLDRKLLKQIDWVTIVLVLALVAIGLISIASIMASPFDGDEASVSDYLAKLNLNYVQRQGVNFLVGIAAFLIVIVFDYSFFKLLIKYAYIGNVALLLILFTVEKTRGIAGWFVFEAIDRAIQPAELCKVCIIIFLAKIVSEGMDQDHGRLRSFKSILFALGHASAGLWHCVCLHLHSGFYFVHCAHWLGVYCCRRRRARSRTAACIFFCDER